MILVVKTEGGYNSCGHWSSGQDTMVDIQHIFVIVSNINTQELYILLVKEHTKK